MGNNNTLKQDDCSPAMFTGLLAIAVVIYFMTKKKSEPLPQRYYGPAVNHSYIARERATKCNNMYTYFIEESSRGRIKYVPDEPEITNLNSLLSDIYVRYIAVKTHEFEYYYKIFHVIFNNLHKKMKEVDAYYKRYSSTVQFAGSHYDGLRINKPDEFDMDVVIGLPLNMYSDYLNNNDIDIEPKDPGFVQLRMGVQYQKLPYRDGIDWHINKTAYKWKDDYSEYLLRSKFLDWFKSVVAKALNEFRHNEYYLPIYNVDGVEYTIRRSESGPAVTLIIENVTGEFKLDVDLVPALRFPENRWPVSEDNREIPPHCKKDFWMVVPKETLSDCISDRSRSWRIALHYQERELMHDSYNLRPAMRLIKKFRDVQGMDEIASYYIKTLFYWEILERNSPTFWRQSGAKLFRIMLQKFYNAMVKGEIPYLWNEENNLIEGVHRSTLDLYALKTRKLIYELHLTELIPSMYKNVAKYLLTNDEYIEYYENYLI